MSIAKSLKKIRIDNELSQKEFAKICGVTISAVSSWEHGVSKPRTSIIEKISKHFGINPNFILSDSKDEVPSINNNCSLKCTLDEKKIIAQYRALNDLGKATVAAVINVQSQSNSSSTQRNIEFISNDEKELLALHRKLNIEDKIEIRGEIKGLLKSDKYKPEVQDEVIWLLSISRKFIRTVPYFKK